MKSGVQSQEYVNILVSFKEYAGIQRHLCHKAMRIPVFDSIFWTCMIHHVTIVQISICSFLITHCEQHQITTFISSSQTH